MGNLKMFKMNKMLDRVSRMIDDAIDGKDIEKSFDETKVSAIENKLHKYLVLNRSHKEKINEEKKRVNELLSDISHQTKTPITNLLLYSELLEECNSSVDKVKYIELIKQQTKKLDFLVSTLIKTSRIENGIIAPLPKLQKIAPLLNSILSEYPLVNITPSKTSCIYDLKWTFEAVSNIVDNAIKYGGSDIRIEVIPYQLFCRINISDNGYGISEEDIPKIFLRFYRSPNVCNSEGVGIGLFIAREIISCQGGYIKVKSIPGVGSTFSVFLPLEKQ